MPPKLNQGTVIRMEIIRKIDVLQKFLNSIRNDGESIGLVPTMGALHQGHFELINYSKKETDLTVCSIYINPVQFNDKKDFVRYPRDEEKDISLLENLGCDVVFIPDDEQMFRGKRLINLDFGSLSNHLEGEFRPGHFNGVALVVSKLFNIVKPEVAFFGQKDLQQYSIIKQMIEEFCFNIELKMIPTVREENGLALSSRNKLFTNEQRKEASKLYQALKKVEDVLQTNNSVLKIKKVVEKFLSSSNMRLEYFEIVKLENFQPVETIEKNNKYGACIAGYLDNIRLIDNIIINTQ